MNARRSAAALLASTALVGLTAAPASAGVVGGRCVPLYGCSPHTNDLNFSAADRGQFYSDVVKVQYWLWNEGYSPGPRDGYYGSRTRSAVIAFQRNNGLAADGVVGPWTWDCLVLCPRGWHPYGRA